MRKAIITAILAGTILSTSVPSQAVEKIAWKAQGFDEVLATAYCVGHTTANGSAVHIGGIAAAPEHMGDVAIVYTTSGQFLGYYECNDTGGDAIRNGYVVDFYRENLEQCEAFMALVKGRVLIKWIEGEG